MATRERPNPTHMNQEAFQMEHREGLAGHPLAAKERRQDGRSHPGRIGLDPVHPPPDA